MLHTITFAEIKKHVKALIDSTRSTAFSNSNRICNIRDKSVGDVLNGSSNNSGILNDKLTSRNHDVDIKIENYGGMLLSSVAGAKVTDRGIDDTGVCSIIAGTTRSILLPFLSLSSKQFLLNALFNTEDEESHCIDDGNDTNFKTHFKHNQTALQEPQQIQFSIINMFGLDKSLLSPMTECNKIMSKLIQKLNSCNHHQYQRKMNGMEVGIDAEARKELKAIATEILQLYFTIRKL